MAQKYPLVLSALGLWQQIQPGDELLVNASTTAGASINIPQGVAPNTPANGDIWTTSAGFFAQINGATQGPFGTISGTVTSVGLSLPSIFTVSNSPVTTAGTLTAVLASQTANRVLAAPNGSNGTPTFRAFVVADISGLGTNVATALGTAATGSGAFVLATSPTLVTPNLGTPSAGVLTHATGLPLTTGVAGTLPVANGGTGTTSATANTFFAAPNGSTGTPAFRAVAGADVPPINLASTSNGGVTGILPVVNGGTGGSTTAAIPRSTGYNILSNTQWEIWSGLVSGARWKADGTGLLPTATLTGNSATGPSTVLTLSAAVPTGWKVGDFVKVNPYVPSADHAVGDFLMPITAISGSTVTVTLPRGITPGGTGTGTVTNMNIGGPASVGTGDAADYWKKTTTLQAWREDNTVNLLHGMTYAMGLQKGSTSAETLSYRPMQNICAGRQMVFGGWIKQQVKGSSGTSRIAIASDGTGGTTTYSSAAAGSGSYEYLEVTSTIPVDATFAQFVLELDGANGDTYLFGNPMAAPGSYLGPNGYSKPREQLIPIVKIEPAAWINASITFPSTSGPGVGYNWSFDFYADSAGAIARSVRLMEGSIEGINTNAVATGTGGSRLIGWVDQVNDPIKTGPFMSQQVTNVKCHRGLRIPMINATGLVFSGIASDVWGNVSIDLDVFHLE